jgi:multidrug resistance efflux pump
MNNEKLIESLEKHRLAIQDETIAKLDFDQLEKDLKEAASALNLLEKKEKLCDQLTEDFKAEIKRMALTLSRIKGNLGSTGLVEKLLTSTDLSYEILER